MMPTYAFMKYVSCKECVENTEVSRILQSILMKSFLILEHPSVTTFERPQESSYFGISWVHGVWGDSILPKLKMDCRNKDFFPLLVSYIGLCITKNQTFSNKNSKSVSVTHFEQIKIICTVSLNVWDNSVSTV